MDKNEIQNNIKEVLKKYVHKQESMQNIKADDSLLELGINSISFIKIIVQLENVFDIEFPEKDLKSKSFDSLNDIAVYVESKLNEKN